MAKKRQSSGLPKPRKSQEELDAESTSESKPLRDYKSRAEREAEVQRRVLIGTIGTLVAVVLLVGIAVLYDQVITPRQAVAEVNGESVSISEFEERIRIERALISEQTSNVANQLIDLGFTADVNEAINQAYQFDPRVRQGIDELQATDRLALRVLNEMIDDLLVEQEAEERGISVTEEDIDAEVERFLEIDRDDYEVLNIDPESTPEVEPTATLTPTPILSPTPTIVPSATNTPAISPTPTLTPFPSATPAPTLDAVEQVADIEDQVGAFYSFVGREASVGRGDIREYFRIQALRRKLAEEVVEQPEMAIWVNSRQILVETEEEARDIIDALNAGESFAALARVSSLDTQSASSGGELGWRNTIEFGEERRDAFRTQEIGAISQEPIETDAGYFILQVREREEREMEDYEREAVLQEEFDLWLEEFRDSEENETETFDVWVDHVPEVQFPLVQYRER